MRTERDDYRRSGTPLASRWHAAPSRHLASDCRIFTASVNLLSVSLHEMLSRDMARSRAVSTSHEVKLS
eukprot:823202-Pleurochrysis_carterae.AAC.1